MDRTLTTAFAAPLLALACIPPARAAAIPASLIGAWSQDTGCPADAQEIVFAARTMEIRQDGEQRSLSEVEAKTGSARDIELQTTRIVFVRQPNSAPPSVGDVLKFRREGDLLRVVAVTMQGRLVDVPPGSAAFHRCPK